MRVKLKYRGRPISDADIAFVRKLIGEHPGLSRRAISVKLCQAWNWVQANGVPRDVVCRGLLLELHRARFITLPPARFVMPRERSRRPPSPIEIDASPLRASLAEIRPLELRQVRRTKDEPLCESLLEAHHYLGYRQPVGEHLKYVVYAHGKPVACLAWSSAARHLGARDRFIGWSAEARRKNIRFIAYNPRFLILPWIQVPHLASHVLGRMARILSEDWQRIYGHPIYFLETFIDRERFRGTCYCAANWVTLGQTIGLGKDARTKTPNRPVKEVLGYPLTPRFRALLSSLQ